MQKQIENHQYLKRMSTLFESETCPSCYSSSFIKLEKTVNICQACDTPFGFDDSMSYYDFKDFFDDISAEDFQMDIINKSYEIDLTCSTCGNKDPDKIILKNKDNSDEVSFYCDICKSYITDDLEPPLKNEDEDNNCCCEKDIDCFQLEFDTEGNFVKGTCKNCKRIILPDYENSVSANSNNFEDDISYNGRVQVESLYLLTEGCHVAWHQPLSYWHHGIVTKVFIHSKKIEVIHFNGPNFPNKGTVIREVLYVDFEEQQMYRIDYKKQVFSNRVVVQRAESRLGQTDYNLFKNNCEHFANWCKTGVSKSTQVSSFYKVVGNKLSTNFITKNISAVKNGFGWLAKYIHRPPSSGSIVKQVSTKAGKYCIGAVIMYEAIETCLDIKRGKEDYYNGKIEKKEFIKITIQRVSQAVGTAIGASVCFAVPILNNTIGTSLSMLIGRGVGNFVGRQLAVKCEGKDKLIE